jgi:eukaryotic-like serine/threonine-protein kinase
VTVAPAILADRYRLTGRIAVGGMGEVWRGEDLVLGRPVAVKVLRDEYAQHRETLARFRAEARHAGALSHPGIAQIYDYMEGDAANPPCLVMELVDGPPLTAVLASGPLSPARTMDIVAQVAEALQAAHHAGLVHRDIKPANLVLTSDGRVKVTDFGIAYAAGSAPITRTGLLVGTPAYLAPERLNGGPATAASDLYALGIVAYECLTGAPPFTGGTPFEIAIAHARQALPSLPPGVPDEVVALVADLTAKDPADRPGSAGQVAWRAGRLADGIGLAVAAPPASADGTLGSMRHDTLVDLRVDRVDRADLDGRVGGTGRRRRPLGWAVAAVVAVAMLAGLVGWLAGTIGASGPTAPPQRPGASQPATSATPGLVSVNATALAGQPVGAVLSQLRQLGLRPVVHWTDHGGPPGQVISVQPSGQVAAGSTVVVVALRPHGDGNNQGNGGGD